MCQHHLSPRTHLWCLKQLDMASPFGTAAIIDFKAPRRCVPSPAILDLIEGFASKTSSAVLSGGEAPLGGQLLRALAYVQTLVARLSGRPHQPRDRSCSPILSK